MFRPRTFRRWAPALASLLIATLGVACASTGADRQERVTRRDKLAKGAGIGAAAGAAGALITGKRKADQILAGAAIGAGIGAGVGAYMDHQEEKLGHIPGTTVERVSDDTLLVRFQSDVLFNIDSAALEPDARASLADVASVVSEYRKTAVVIQGYTDSTGSEEHNQELSERRATSVYNYFAGQGIDPGRMVALGNGESYPVASNETPGGRQLNRRVEVLLKAKAV